MSDMIADTTNNNHAARLRETAPRYTSYPTAPHFHPGVTGEIVRGWLAALPAGDSVSLYLHIPFCDRLCWFCACHTKQTLRYAPVARYLEALKREIATVGGLLSGRASVGTIHFGGGSPTMLRPDDLRGLMATLRSAFAIPADAAISVEIDPNDMDEQRLDALADIGLTRASLGIQDFDPKVQRAINREQSFELTRDVVEGLRARGVGSVNLDLLYGLPHQTLASLAATVTQSLSLRPDRIALFGYAHVPWMKKHQEMIDPASLPDAEARLAQSLLAADLIADAGYVPIGIDHFALPCDGLAVAAREGRLRRNFQGYTDDTLETLVGLGPSAVSRFREGYAQNEVATGSYERMVGAGELATVRGVALTAADRLRAWIIERLMCDFAFSASEALGRFGPAAQEVLAEAALLTQGGPAAMLARAGDRFVVPEADRPFVRTLAARFDPYLAKGTARHSAAV